MAERARQRLTLLEELPAQATGQMRLWWQIYYYLSKQFYIAKKIVILKPEMGKNKQVHGDDTICCTFNVLALFMTILQKILRVTNPPDDPLREAHVSSSDCWREMNVL